ncbi:MAG: fibronectin type III domain-containing protein, partial [Candidatus Cloacimonetes bacterium]|nr:fibronectin type III domain-containing protein [Candidatus Cloacimonadota bacterium]
AIAIVKGDPEVYVDIFGNIGDATYWASAPLSATNQTLRRKSTVLSGVTVDLDNDAGFPTLATEWDSYVIDTVADLGTHSIGASSPVSGYQDLAVSSNIARVSGLDPETEYSYRVRAENIGDTSDNSNTIIVTTTASTAGTGANTTIGGAATTVLLPVISSYSNNNVVLDPATSSNDDFAVSVSTITGGIRYSFVTTNNSAFNGSYTLNHNGLGYIPGTLLYRLGGETFSSSNYSSTATQTSVTISGLSRNRGTFEIDLLQATQSLGVPIVTISVAGDTITLNWDAIDGATSYRIEAADSPEGTFSSLGTTANLTFSHSSLTRKFYKVYALN